MLENWKLLEDMANIGYFKGIISDMNIKENLERAVIIDDE